MLVTNFKYNIMQAAKEKANSTPARLSWAANTCTWDLFYLMSDLQHLKKDDSGASLSSLLYKQVEQEIAVS